MLRNCVPFPISERKSINVDQATNDENMDIRSSSGVYKIER